MLQLSPGQLIRLRALLVRSRVFDSDATLHAVFVDPRITPWCNHISDNTPNRAARVDALIDALHNQANTSDENALLLFLQVLLDQQYIPQNTADHRDLTAFLDEFDLAAQYCIEGDLDYANQRYRDAISDYTRAIALQPANSEYYFWRGMSHWLLKEHDAALADLTRAIELNPEDVRLYFAICYNLARVHVGLRQTAEACAWLEKAIAVDEEGRTARSDPDFDPIRDAPCFRDLVSPTRH